MAYCRSGKDSDVYLFGSGHALELYIAHNRGSAGRIKFPPKKMKKRKRKKEIKKYFLDTIPLEHPEAGKAYAFTKRSECWLKLFELSQSGLRVPDHALDRLAREIDEVGDSYDFDTEQWMRDYRHA